MLRPRLTTRRKAGTEIYDDFTRADAATLGIDWTNRVSSANQLILKSNQAGCNDADAFGCSIATTTMSSNNIYVAGTIGTGNTHGESRLLYLNSNTSNQILAYFFDTGGVDIGKHNAAYSSSRSYTQLGYGTECSFTDEDILSFEATNGIYIARINGDVVASFGNNRVTPLYTNADLTHREVGFGVDGAVNNDGFTDFYATDIGAKSDDSVRAFDISTSAAPNQAWFNQAWDAGYRLFIVDATNTDRSGAATAYSLTSTHLGYALNAGMKIAGYSRDPALWSIGIGACAPYVSQLQFWTIDIEPMLGGSAVYLYGGCPYTTTKINSYLAGVTGLGVRPVIYTGGWAWNGTDDVTAGPVVDSGALSAYSAIPLWDSVNDDAIWKPLFTPSMQVPTPYEFGGWNTPSTFRIGAQQSLNTTLNGVLIDVSSWDPSFLTV